MKHALPDLKRIFVGAPKLEVQDVYFTHRSLSWTLVVTHEEHCGPYLVMREEVGSFRAKVESGKGPR